MKYKIAYIVTGFIFVLLGFGFSNQEDTPIQFEEQVKIALRDVGNILLLYQGDSTSLILPVKTLESSRFQLAFENSLQIHPKILVHVVGLRI